MNRKYDVIVVGGGIAGVSASVAAARGGLKVLLIEKSVNLGGLATSGLISWYEPLCDGNGNQMVYGIAEELIRLCGKYSFENLPPAYIETAEFDCLHDDGILYAQKLREAGIDVTLNETNGTMHGFDIMQKAETTLAALVVRIEFMKKHFSNLI